MGGQWYDANIAIPGCDKNMPGCLIAMGRVNRPAIMVRLAVGCAGGGGSDMCWMMWAVGSHGGGAGDRILPVEAFSSVVGRILYPSPHPRNALFSSCRNTLTLNQVCHPLYQNSSNSSHTPAHTWCLFVVGVGSGVRGNHPRGDRSWFYRAFGHRFRFPGLRGVCLR